MLHNYESAVPFTPEQEAIIAHSGGHALVAAVPGSGKTTTMIGRVRSLLEAGVNPDAILVLMFNKDAQTDFSRRLAKACGPGAELPLVATFNSYGHRLCSKLVELDHLYDAKLITEDWQTLKLFRQAIRQANETIIGEPISDEPDAISDLAQFIDLAKCKLIGPNDGAALNAAFPEANPRFSVAYSCFEEIRSAARLRTFADQLFEPVSLIEQNNAVRDLVSNHYDHIIVDEYQDINLVQQKLVLALAGIRAKVMAVGDEDQCIYGWRGARPDFMVDQFSKFFPGAVRYKLSMTHRYGHRVSLVANSVIANNSMRMPKLCVSAESTPRTAVDALPCSSEDDIGQVTLAAVSDWLKRGGKHKDIAVLVREYGHTIPIELEFLRARVPHVVVGAETALNRAELLSMRGYLAYAAKRIVEMPGDARAKMMDAMLSIPSAYLRREVREQFVATAAQDDGLHVLREMARGSDDMAASIHRVFNDWNRACSRVNGEMQAAHAIGLLVNALELERYFKSNTVNRARVRERLAIYTGFQSYAAHTGLSVSDFCQHLDDLAASAVKERKADAVLITSVHRSKGLEWPHVILPNLFEGKFPSYNVDDDDPKRLPNFEEERRLFYVAQTRAKHRLTMLCPADRLLLEWLRQGQTGHPPAGMRASRFLFESNAFLSKAFVAALESGESIRSRVPRCSPVMEEYLKAIKHPEAIAGRSVAPAIPQSLLNLL